MNNASMIDIELDQNTMFFLVGTYEDAMKAVKVKCSREIKKKSMYYLYQNGYFGRTARKDLFYIKFVDIDNSEENIVDYIYDYDHIDLHYEKLFLGATIGTCKHCGCLFKQNKTGRLQYCYKHRGYNKKGLRFGKCIDCGNEFYVAATNHRKVRCDNCQKIKDRESKRIWKLENQKNG